MQRVKKLLNSSKPLTWVFYGDSITHGVVHTFGWRDYTELFAERVRCEMARHMDVVINTAISGNTTDQLIEGFDWRVGRYSPDVVFIMIGMNDCSKERNIPPEDFKANLNKLAGMLDGMGTICVMQTTCPILPNTAPDRADNFDDYMQAIRDAASQNQLPLIDHTNYWRENEDKLYYLMSNEFHPNEIGHRFFARLIFEQLGIYDPQSNCCKLFIP